MTQKCEQAHGFLGLFLAVIATRASTSLDICAFMAVIVILLF
jgi:hypothetical protein